MTDYKLLNEIVSKINHISVYIQEIGQKLNLLILKESLSKIPIEESTKSLLNDFESLFQLFSYVKEKIEEDTKSKEYLEWIRGTIVNLKRNIDNDLNIIIMALKVKGQIDKDVLTKENIKLSDLELSMIMLRNRLIPEYNKLLSSGFEDLELRVFDYEIKPNVILGNMNTPELLIDELKKFINFNIDKNWLTEKGWR